MTYSEFVFAALVIQHAKRMRRIVICNLTCSTEFFLFHKRHIFRKKVTEHKVCVLIFSTTFVRNISHSKKNSARYDHENACWSSSKVSLFLFDFNYTWGFWTDFRKLHVYQIS